MTDQSTNQSPLYEADPNSLDEFFLRLANNQIKFMPNEILYTDFPKRVKFLRQDRERFILDQKNLKELKPKREPKSKRIENLDMDI